MPHVKLFCQICLENLWPSSGVQNIKRILGSQNQDFRQNVRFGQRYSDSFSFCTLINTVIYRYIKQEAIKNKVRNTMHTVTDFRKQSTPAKRRLCNPVTIKLKCIPESVCVCAGGGGGTNPQEVLSAAITRRPLWRHFPEKHGLFSKWFCVKKDRTPRSDGQRAFVCMWLCVCVCGHHLVEKPCHISPYPSR